MALKFRRIKKAFGFDKTKTEKYVVTPDRGAVVPFKDLCEQIALVSGVNKGNVVATLDALAVSMRTYILQGHAVRVEGIDTYVPSFNAKSSPVEGETNADSIYRMKLRFIPCSELRDMMYKIEVVFNTKDSTSDSDDSDDDDRPVIE